MMAANPCPCGFAIGKGLQCTCTPMNRRRYFARLAGPLLDRVDLQVEVSAVSRVDLAEGSTGEDTATIAARVLAAREAQRERLLSRGWHTNAEVPGAHMRTLLGADRVLLRDLDRALDRGLITLRGADRVLRVAWTLADLAGRTAPSGQDISGALALRTRGNYTG